MQTYAELNAAIDADALSEATIAEALAKDTAALADIKAKLATETEARDAALVAHAESSNEGVYSELPVGKDGIKRIRVYETVKDASGKAVVVTKTAIVDSTPLDNPFPVKGSSTDATVETVKTQTTISPTA